MPELPEVETTRLALSPQICGKILCKGVVVQRSLRWPVSAEFPDTLIGDRIADLDRRGKYLLFRFTRGTLIVHLGMSGYFRFVDCRTPLENHDHIELRFEGDLCLRYNDSRRFGAFLWTTNDPLLHPLLRDMGPEPLSTELTGGYLFGRSRSTRVSVKTFVMDQKVVAGVGNIYANEALFEAGLLPAKAVCALDVVQANRLADALKAVLSRAIASGRNSLERFFFHRPGEKPGYFPQTLNVYDRDGAPCRRCGHPVVKILQGGRASYFCPQCQS